MPILFSPLPQLALQEGLGLKVLKARQAFLTGGGSLGVLAIETI